MKQLEPSVARIFSSGGKTVAGIGFLVSDKRVITCVHVIATAVGIDRSSPTPPSKAIELDFPLVGSKRYTASVIVWLPPQANGEDDIAVLEIDGDIPSSTAVAQLKPVENLWNLTFGVFGIPKANPKGVWAAGIVRGRIEGQRIQIEDELGTSYFIEPGFSGSPVYSEQAGGVIGMVASAEADPKIRAGFMIPAGVLLAKMQRRTAIHDDSTESAEPLLSTTNAEAFPSNPSTSSTQSVSAWRAASHSGLIARTRSVYVGVARTLRRNYQNRAIFVAHNFFGNDIHRRNEYRTFFKDGLLAHKYQPIFANDESGTILETVCQSIIDAEAGIYDVTSYNANVLIELGMSIGLNQPTIVIAEDDSQPLLSFLQQLEPFRYADLYDLSEQIGSVVDTKLAAYQELFTSPTYCTTCGKECKCRRMRLESDGTCLLIGADPVSDKHIVYNLKQVLKELKGLRFASIAADDTANRIICGWTDIIRQSEIALLHSKERGQRHHGAENAETMLRVGIAIGTGIPWRMLLADNERMPTDLESCKYVPIANDTNVFRGQLDSVIKLLRSETRLDASRYDPLLPPELVPTEEDNVLVQDLEKSTGTPKYFWRVPNLPSRYIDRPNERRSISEALLGESKIVSIIGSGGVGKTVLATAVCHDPQIQATFSDGIFWISASSTIDGENVSEQLREIAHLLHVQDTVFLSGSVIDQLDHILDQRNCLLVIDEAHLLQQMNNDSVTDLQEAITSLAKPSSKLLLTVQNEDYIRVLPAKFLFSVTSIALEPAPQRPLFFNYSHIDRQFAQRLASSLRDAGFRSWIDVEGIVGGDIWRETIEKGIQECNVFLNIISPDALRSDWARWEVQQAKQYRIPIINITIKPASIPNDMVGILNIDFMQNYDAGLQKLLGYLQSEAASVPSFNPASADDSLSGESSPTQPYVYILHSSRDRLTTEKLNNDLRQLGAEVRVGDSDSQHSGSHWKDTVREAGSVLYLASPNSVTSQSVRRELEWAESYQKLIIPVWIAGYPATQVIPSDLHNLQYIDIRDENYEGGIRRIAEALGLEYKIRSKPREVRVFLSSPSDVVEEHIIAMETLNRLSQDPTIQKRGLIRPVTWEQVASAPLIAAVTPMQAINVGLPQPSECDIVVLIIWSSMGAPLPAEYVKPDGTRYLSSTEWELENARAAQRTDEKPLIVVYRRTETVFIDINDPELDSKREQQARVREFFATFADSTTGELASGYNAYETIDEFQSRFESDMRILIGKLLAE